MHRFKQQITWETCSAREWLNDTFLNTAFSKEEQKAIPITELDNSDRLNPKIKFKGELNNTQDRIFLLSKTEAGIYLISVNATNRKNHALHLHLMQSRRMLLSVAYIRRKKDYQQGNGCFGRHPVIILTEWL